MDNAHLLHFEELIFYCRKFFIVKTLGSCMSGWTICDDMMFNTVFVDCTVESGNKSSGNSYRIFEYVDAAEEKDKPASKEGTDAVYKLKNLLPADKRRRPLRSTKMFMSDEEVRTQNWTSDVSNVKLMLILCLLTEIECEFFVPQDLIDVRWQPQQELTTSTTCVHSLQLDKQRHLHRYPLDKKNQFSCLVLITCFFLHLLLNAHLDCYLIREV